MPRLAIVCLKGTESIKLSHGRGLHEQKLSVLFMSLLEFAWVGLSLHGKSVLAVSK